MDHNKAAHIRKFVRNLLNDAPDLSALTLGSIKRQYMSHVGCESLSPEAKTCIKRVVGEALLNMQISATDVSESEIASVEPPSNKRKRGEDKKANSERSIDEELSAKKICRRRTSSGSAGSKEEEQIDQNEDKDQCPVQESEKDQDGAEEQINLTEKPRYLEGSVHPLEGEKKVGKSDKKPRRWKRQTKASSDEGNLSSVSDEISEEEDKDSTKKGAPDKKLDSKQKGIKGGGAPESRKQQAKSSTDEEKDSSQSDQSSEDDHDVPKKEEAPANKLNKEKVPTTTSNEDPQHSDSSSSSLTSLEEEKDVKGDGAPAMKLTIKKGDKKKRKEDDSKRATEENKAVLRLKRYISLCGVRRNYKKLFEGHGSVRSKVSVLKKELEDLGIEGLPSIEKCKKARKKLEEAKELAELDVSNIITTQGRPTRRGPSAWKEPHSSPAARYKRTLNSDSEEGSPAEKGPNRNRHWGNLQGIISDDGESD